MMRKLLYWVLALVVGLSLSLPMGAQKVKSTAKSKRAKTAQSSQAAESSNKGGETRGTERAAEVQMQHKGETAPGMAKTSSGKAKGKSKASTAKTKTTHGKKDKQKEKGPKPR